MQGMGFKAKPFSRYGAKFLSPKAGHLIGALALAR